MAAGDVIEQIVNIKGVACVKFDGVDDSIELGTWTQSQYQQNMTLTGWVKRKNNSAAHVIIGSKSATGFFIRFASGSNNIGVWIRNNVTSTFTNAGVVGEWMHFAVILRLNSDEVTLYKNGAFVNTIANTDEFSSTGNLSLGARGASLTQDPLNGMISDVRIYDAELTAAEILKIYNGDDVTRNLIKRYKLNNNSNELLSGATSTDTGVTYRIEEDDIANAIAALRVTANDKYFLTDLGNGRQIMIKHIEEAP